MFSGKSDKSTLEAILSNHIDVYAGDKLGACISARRCSQLIEDIILWKGISFTINEIAEWACEHTPDQLTDPVHGIAATTRKGEEWIRNMKDCWSYSIKQTWPHETANGRRAGRGVKMQ